MFEHIREIWRRSSTAGEPYPAELAFLLRNPLRRFILSPAELVRRLEPEATDRILELGPGPGYFSVAAARAVPAGQLVLVDLQPAMLEKVRRRLTRSRIANASCLAADARDLPLADASIDAAFLVAVLGEVPNPNRALLELYRVIRSGGRLLLTEQPGDADFIPREHMTELATAAGFEPRRHWGARHNYSAEFLRP